MDPLKEQKILYLFTSQYPFGTGETFIENELSVLSARFSKICIFPLSRSGEARSLPANSEVIDWQKEYRYKKYYFLFRYFALYSRILFAELRSGPGRMRSFRMLKSVLLQNIARADHISSFIQKDEGRNIFYTFWFDDWATVLGLLKEQGKIPFFYTRIHGYDLYSERRKEGFIPFRDFQVASVRGIFAVSKDGQNYLSALYPEHAAKIKLFHLGVFDKGINPRSNDETLTIVSCSNVIPIKRVHLIAELLKDVTVPVKWFHFGDGPAMNELRSKAKTLGKNIEVSFPGKKENAEIIDFYRKTPVSVFLHMSETEGGVPIAIQEAVSFGIPVFAAAAGGVPEIVNERTGLLFPVDADLKSIARELNNFTQSKYNTEVFREGARDFWTRNFDAGKEFEAFSDELLKE